MPLSIGFVIVRLFSKFPCVTWYQQRAKSTALTSNYYQNTATNPCHSLDWFMPLLTCWALRHWWGRWPWAPMRPRHGWERNRDFIEHSWTWDVADAATQTLQAGHCWQSRLKHGRIFEYSEMMWKFALYAGCGWMASILTYMYHMSSATQSLVLGLSLQNNTFRLRVVFSQHKAQQGLQSQHSQVRIAQVLERRR